MVKTINKASLTLLIFVVFISTGCTRLEQIDKRVGEIFFDEEDMGTSTAPVKPILAGELTSEQKEQIDKWLIENSLNRYGDPEGIMYAGGTPLFNEATGEQTERFEYILVNHPDILTQALK